MNGFSVTNLRAALHDTSMAEHELWKVLLNKDSMPEDSARQYLLPLDPNTLALYRIQADEVCNSVKLGVCPFVIEAVYPLTDQAREAGIYKLADALKWCSKVEILSSDLSCANDTLSAFTRKYLNFALSLSKKAPTIAAACLGIDVETARVMSSNSVDRLTIEQYLRHFLTKFVVIGTDLEFRGQHRDPVQLALADLIESSSKDKNLRRQLLLTKMFYFRPSKLNKPRIEAVSLEDEIVRQTLRFFQQAKLRQPTVQRFLELFPLKTSDAYNLSRSLLKNTERERMASCSPEKSLHDLIVQISQCITIRALGQGCTVSEVIEIFCVACLLAVNVFGVGNFCGLEGDFIAWLEKKQKDFLPKLVKPQLILCGEAKKLSAKNNVLGGAESD